MSKPYNQWTAMWSIVKASTKAIFKSPQAVFFSLFFPIVLIVIFGALSGGGGITLDVAIDKSSDTTNVIYAAIKNVSALKIINSDDADIQDRLKKGRITALISINKSSDSTNPYVLNLKTSSAVQKQDLNILTTILNSVIAKIDEAAFPSTKSIAKVSTEEVPGRQYKLIDFYLPGMLGFSLIGAAVFGVAFVFFSLRETLVLKRMYSTPIKKGYIVAGESIARILFQLATALVLILFGKFFYGFTLSNGWITFFELIALSFLGLIVFMGFGFFISSIAKNQNVIPIYANLFMFPQYFLSGTFFPKSALPAGMQGFIKFLPLTALNDAMRKISFEGLHIWQTPTEVLILAAWGIIMFIIAARVFKWES
ncbi:MAG: ABC transporter permease [Sphingobacteriales bacterium]|nr:ABC transporter permease [Sphingobacteriales bacterium]MBI3720153.1 ABC transporter permease [Sphingobacteriales bacterium]